MGSSNRVIFGEYPLPFDNYVGYYINQDNANVVWLRLDDIEVIAGDIPVSYADSAVVINKEQCVTVNVYKEIVRFAAQRDPSVIDKLVEMTADSIKRYAVNNLKEEGINVNQETNSQRDVIEGPYLEDWNLCQNTITQLISTLGLPTQYIKSWQMQVSNIINKVIDGSSTINTRKAVCNNNHQWVSQTNTSEVRSLKGKARRKLAEYINIYNPQSFDDLKALAIKAATDVKRGNNKSLSVRLTQ